jgi:uncharacterized phage protein gp47/JayE
LGAAGDGRRTRLICGFFGCDERPYNPLLTALPSVIHLPAAGTDGGTRPLGAMLEHAIREERRGQPGTENWFFYNAVANAGMLQYANIATIRPGVTPLNATGQDLEDWRIALGLPVVGASPSSGKLTVGVAPGATITVPDGLNFVLPNGLRGRVTGTHLGIVNGDDVAVICIDTGADTNADSRTKVRFVNGPFNLDTEARVSAFGPLTGGFDEETEARKRERVLNRLRTSAGGGNWGQLRELAFNALATLQDCYVYPALGGPSSCKVVLIRAFDVERNDYQRALSDGAVTLVKNAIHKNMPDGQEVPVETVAEEAVDVGLYLTLPDSSLAGGNGLGWTDQSPWPPAGSGTKVTVTSVSATNVITVDAVSCVEPIPGLLLGSGRLGTIFLILGGRCADRDHRQVPGLVLARAPRDRRGHFLLPAHELADRSGVGR